MCIRDRARWFLRVARAQTGTAISKVAQAAPDSKDTLKTLRIAHVAALKGSRYRVLDEDGYDALAPAVGGVLPALVDDLSEKSRSSGRGLRWMCPSHPPSRMMAVIQPSQPSAGRWLSLLDPDQATQRLAER